MTARPARLPACFVGRLGAVGIVASDGRRSGIGQVGIVASDGPSSGIGPVRIVAIVLVASLRVATA